jgi:hypothetical protein
MAYLFKVDRYELGHERDEETGKKSNEFFGGLETVFKEVYPEAHKIAPSGRGVFNYNHIEQRAYGKLYELPNGAVYVDMTCVSHKFICGLEGTVAVIGDDGQNDNNELLRKIFGFFGSLGVKFVGELWRKDD